MNNLPATATVLALKDIRFEGNLIPEAWYQHLKMDDGKPNLPAIVILSEILYWYRPQVLRDEETGNTHYYRKFRPDMLQKSYDQLATKFGLTKRQAKDAINYLISKGLITREFRNIPGPDGALMANVMFVDLIIAELLRISGITPPSDVITPDRLPSKEGYDDKTPDPPRYNGARPAFKRQTNTESTTETSSETIHPSPPVEPAEGMGAGASAPGGMDGGFKKGETGDPLTDAEQQTDSLLRQYGVKNPAKRRALLHVPNDVIERLGQGIQQRASSVKDPGGVLAAELTAWSPEDEAPPPTRPDRRAEAQRLTEEIQTLAARRDAETNRTWRAEFESQISDLERQRDTMVALAGGVR